MAEHLTCNHEVASSILAPGSVANGDTLGLAIGRSAATDLAPGSVANGDTLGLSAVAVALTSPFLVTTS